MTEYRRPYRRASLVWPVVLISLGVIFLLNNLGIVDWDIWSTIIRLWPMLLIITGLDILLGRRSGVWPVVSVLLMVAMVSGALWLVQSASTFMEGSIVTQKIVQPLDGANEAELEIKFGAGGLTVSGLKDSVNLVEGVLALEKSENLEQSYRLVGDKGYFALESNGSRSAWLGFGDGFLNSREWTLEVTDSIPLDIRISTGAGRSKVDLRGLDISSLDIETGVGEVAVYLPASGQYEANISGGVGLLKVFIPRDLPARIIVNSGVGNTSVNGDFDQEGNVWESPDFSGSEDGAEVHLSGGVGSIEVIQIEP